MRRWGELVLRHRKVVMLLWLVVAAAGISVTGTVNNRLTFSFSLPGQPGNEAANKIIEAFHNGGNASPLIPPVTLPAGQKITGHENAVAKSFAAIASADPQH